MTAGYRLFPILLLSGALAGPGCERKERTPRSAVALGATGPAPALWEPADKGFTSCRRQLRQARGWPVSRRNSTTGRPSGTEYVLSGKWRHLRSKGV